MLQWMGGSRRKVTTSRKSTHKRQKQYFEQRKRQQQQRTAFEDGYYDTTNTCTQRQLNNQSLDVCSLLALSAAQEHQSSYGSISEVLPVQARENLNTSVSTLNCQTSAHQPTLQTPDLKPLDHDEIMKESCSGRTVPERVSMRSPCSPCKEFDGNERLDHLKMSNDQQLSVLDLLGDDELTRKFEGRVQEAHVAFSVGGVGNVETQTPVHSPQGPQQPDRYSPYGCFMSSKVKRNARSLKDFKSKLNDLASEMMQDCFNEDDEIPLNENEFAGVIDSLCYPNQNKSSSEGFLQINNKGPNLKNFLGTDSGLFNSEDENEYPWTESSSLPGGFLGESKCHSSWNNWPHQTNSNSTDYYCVGNHAENDFAFEGSDIQSIRFCAKGTRSNVSDSVGPYRKGRISGNFHCFPAPDETWYPEVGRMNVRSGINQPAWSCFPTKDANESLSFLSEESCSSSAVWGQAIEKPPSNSTGKNTSAHGSEYMTPVRRTDVKNIYSHKTYCRKQESVKLKDNIHNSVKCEKMSSAKPNTIPKRIGADKSWLFEFEDSTRNMNSGIESLFQTSGAKESQSSGCQLWDEDLFNVCSSVPNVKSDAKLFCERLKSGVSSGESPSCTYFTEKPTFCEPFDQSHSNGTTFFPDFRPSKKKLSPVFDMQCNHQDPFDDLGCQDDRQFPGITVCESVCLDGEKEVGILETDGDKVEPQEDVCNGSNCLSSENKMSGNGLDAGDSCSHFNEAKDRTQELMENPKASSPENAEDVSSVEGLKAPEKSEGGLDNKGYQNNIQILPYQNGCKDSVIEDFGPKEKKMESKKQNNNTNQSCQVTMLESYGLQLLSVHVLNEASNRGTVKKMDASESLEKNEVISNLLSQEYPSSSNSSAL